MSSNINKNCIISISFSGYEQLTLHLVSISMYIHTYDNIFYNMRYEINWRAEELMDFDMRWAWLKICTYIQYNWDFSSNYTRIASNQFDSEFQIIKIKRQQSEFSKPWPSTINNKTHIELPFTIIYDIRMKFNTN